MRKLKLQVQISIDGYIADVNRSTDWMVWNWGNDWNWDDELKKYFNNLAESFDCILLSRKMVEEGFIAHWAEAAKSPNPQFAFARKITEAHKVVFTKTLNKSEWDNTVLAKGDLIEEVNKLKNTTGSNIIAYGGATFASSLIKSDLVDEFHFIVNPSVLGSGLPIFNQISSRLNLSLISSTSYACGVAVLIYGRK